MTRFTLLATAATFAAAPAFAQSNDSDTSDMSNTGSDMAQESGQTDTSDMSNTGSEMAQESGQNTENSLSGGLMSSGDLDQMIRTSNIEGGDLYAVDEDDGWTDNEWDGMEYAESVDQNWDDIGNITDVVLSPDGQQIGLVVSVGGFLDIGDQTVLLTTEDVRRIGTVDEIDGDFNYVTRLTETQIEEMDQVEENWF